MLYIVGVCRVRHNKKIQYTNETTLLISTHSKFMYLYIDKKKIMDNRIFLIMIK